MCPIIKGGGMLKPIIAATLIGILSAPTASSSESYLCVADKATGFSYDETTKEWNQTSFKADKKYSISVTQQKRCLTRLLCRLLIFFKILQIRFSSQRNMAIAIAQAPYPALT